MSQFNSFVIRKVNERIRDNYLFEIMAFGIEEDVKNPYEVIAKFGNNGQNRI